MDRISVLGAAWEFLYQVAWRANPGVSPLDEQIDVWACALAKSGAQHAARTPSARKSRRNMRRVRS